jgi:hypothetical protein
MAENTSNNIENFLLEIDIEHRDYLEKIRHWSNLSVAFDENSIWLRNISKTQVDSMEIKSIPFKKIYYLKDDLLFLKDSLLPLKRLQRSLLWSPISRALPVKLPFCNNNFFGINEKIEVKIVPSEIEKIYIENAPKIRLQNLVWTIVNQEILIIGTPILPIQGKTFWNVLEFIFPSGYDLEFPLLDQIINSEINPFNENFIFFQENGKYVNIPKDKFRPLSISSFRLTFSN